jgi:hypothetical protein
MYIGLYLRLLVGTEADLAASFDAVASNHTDEPDVSAICAKFAEQSTEQSARLQPFAERCGDSGQADVRRSHLLVHTAHPAPLRLLDDLHDSYILASEVDIVATIAYQAAQMLRDGELVDTLAASCDTTARQLAWLTTRIKQAAPQALFGRQRPATSSR